MVILTDVKHFNIQLHTYQQFTISFLPIKKIYFIFPVPVSSLHPSYLCTALKEGRKGEIDGWIDGWMEVMGEGGCLDSHLIVVGR